MIGTKAVKFSHSSATSSASNGNSTNNSCARDNEKSDKERLLIKKPNSTAKSSQQVPFLQRKFNLFTNHLTSGNNHCHAVDQTNKTGSNFKGKAPKVGANTLPRTGAVSNSVEGKSVQSGVVNNKVKQVESSTETFKGVQSLKQFWNSRIIGSASSGDVKQPKVAKSSAANSKSVENCRDSKSEPAKVIPSRKSASVQKEKQNNSIAGKQKESDEKVTLREKFVKSDNFDKYKTASSVKLHRVSQDCTSSITSPPAEQPVKPLERKSGIKRHTIDSVPKLTPTTTGPSQISTLSRNQACNSLQSKNTLNFPQIKTTATGGKIHWAKREDILGQCNKPKRKTNECETSTMIKEPEIKARPVLRRMEQKNNKIEIVTDTKEIQTKAKLEDQNEDCLKSEDFAKCTKDRKNSSTESRSTTPSSTVSTMTSITNSRTESPRKPSTHRKASFKTHSGQSQSIRKMAVGGSKVATLTNRFNQMIQQDASILDEVKRKGVVVHKINGHIYKIKEEAVSNGDPISSSPIKKLLVTKTSSASSDSKGQNKVKRRKSSVRRHDSIKKSSSVTSIDKKGVKATIQLFEKTPSKAPSGQVGKHELIKPKVPDKSEQVLKRTQEIVTSRKADEGEANQSNLIIHAKKSLKLDGFKDAVKEKMLTPIQENSPSVTEATVQLKPEPAKLPLESPNPPTYDVKPKRDKSVYGRIYDKIKLNKPSFLYSKRTPKPESSAIHISTPVLNSSTYELRDSVPIAEQKIYEALKTVNQKIENITRSSIELNFGDYDEKSEGSNQAIKPNQSFLFRTNNCRAPDNYQSSLDLLHEEEPCEAFNIGLIKSKTQSMDETLFPFTIVPLNSSISSANVEETIDEDAQEAIIGNGREDSDSDVHNDYQHMINGTDQLIKKMSETYGVQEPSTTPVNSDRVEDKPEMTTIENNYELYEQIQSDDEDMKKKQSSVAEEDYEEEDCLYQTVSEVKSAIRNRDDKHLNDTISVNSYESFDNYEAIDELRRNHFTTKGLRPEENGYEICEPPEPPPPRKISSDTANGPPSLPMPKRNLSNQPTSQQKSYLYSGESEPKIVPEPKDNVTIFPSDNHHHHNDYEDENIYDTIKGGADNTSLLSNNYESISLMSHSIAKSCKRGNTSSTQQPDTISYTSNCYESLQGSTLTINQIGNRGKYASKGDDFLRMTHALRHSDSITTLSSDHKTNSLYGTTISYGQSNAASNRNSVVGDNLDNETYSKLKPPSENSENSEDWIDISDGEDDNDDIKHKQLIIIRERTKCHRSPDWSRKIREQRIHQSNFYDVAITSQSTIYLIDKVEQTQPILEIREPLYENTATDGQDDASRGIELKKGNEETLPFNVFRSVEFLQKKAPSECFNNAYGDRRSGGVDHGLKTPNNLVVEWESQHLSVFIDDSDHHYESLYSDNYENQQLGSRLAPSSQPSKAKDIIPFDDEEFDSFDSDLETDEDVKKNDSGVDVSNMRLPDPPSSSNQVYALMQKIKNPLSEISKSLTRFAKKKKSLKTSDSSRKYENLNESTTSLYQTNLKTTKSGSSKLKKSSTLSLNQKSNDPYENTDFHTPRTPVPTSPQPLSPGVPILESTPSSPPFAELKDSKPDQSQSPFLEYNGTTPAVVPMPRKKKGAKSFKSKLRRSLVPDTSNLSAFNTNRSTFYISDSVDVDSGIFTGSDKTLKAEDSVSSLKLETSMVDLVNEIKSRNLKNTTTSSTEDVRRRSMSTSSRPLSPPPPPPTLMTQTSMDKKIQKPKRFGTTSWYDECGVFKEVKEVEKKNSQQSMTNWYADAGLYQTSGDSVASSSGSSGVSTGGECNGTDDNSHGLFSNEPLYQIYSAAKLESISRDIELENEHDGYEEIGKSMPSSGEEEQKKSTRPTALQLVGPKQGPSRTLWSEIPEVINSEILSTLTPTEKRLQEAKFEIVTSEASYLKSLNLLKSLFMNHPAFRDVNILSAADRKTLFSYTIPVLECSDRLLCDLENCWQDNIMLLGLSHSIFKHADASFKVYVSYCEHQVRLDRILKKLKESNRKFCEVLEQLESDPVCCGLSFHSFLMLPMQRITRLPLLIDAVLSKLKPDDDEYENWKMTLAILNKIVAQCNEAAHRCEQAYEMQYISRQIEFPSDISPLSIIPVGIPAANNHLRALVRKGELTHLVWRGDDGKLTFGKKFAKSSIYAFLFTDLLVLTKKKSDDSYLVFDYCPRSMLTVSSGDVIPQLPTRDVSMAGKHLILMTLLENHCGKTVELILSCQSETDRTRWLQATEPPLSDNPDETLYEQWDCPQVTVQHGYQAKQPDELNLDPGDIVNVTRKMADGWYHGERIRDGTQGWFPGNYTEEVASPHVRARNLKQRYRLLTFTATYLESQKKK